TLGCTLALDSPDSTATAISLAETRSRPGAELADSLPIDESLTGVNGIKLQAALDWAFSEPDPSRLRRTRALVVLRDGRIVSERYAPGFSATTPMPGWSMAKTTAAVLVGALVGSGKLSVSQKALLPEWRAAGDSRAEITLDQLLRMTSALHFSEQYGDPTSDV